MARLASFSSVVSDRWCPVSKLMHCRYITNRLSACYLPPGRVRQMVVYECVGVLLAEMKASHGYLIHGS